MVAQIKQQPQDGRERDCGMTLGSMKLGHNDIQEIEGLISNWHEIEADVSACETANAKMHEFPEHVATALSCFEVQGVRQQPTHRFPWLSCVCRHRDLFSRACFRFNNASDTKHVKFLFALQN